MHTEGTNPAALPPVSAEVLERALAREKARRVKAELLLENKSRELFEASEELRKTLKKLRDNQKQLVQQEKMASLGVLSAGVAHEINNPVGFVLSNVNTLSDYVKVFMQGFTLIGDGLDSLGDDVALKADYKSFVEDQDLSFVLEDSESLMSETKDGLIRVRDIVEGLKNFARADDSNMGMIDVNDAVRSALTMVRNQVKYKCTVEEDLAELPQVRGNVSRLGQVFLNLVVNASHAAGEDCWIKVSSFVDGQHVCVTVQDNGCGIPPEHLDKLFTPFFTTKPVGEGTGLGLAISHGIVSEHGGEIVVDSTVDVGTNFTVKLPISIEHH